MKHIHSFCAIGAILFSFSCRALAAPAPSKVKFPRRSWDGQILMWITSYTVEPTANKGANNSIVPEATGAIQTKNAYSSMSFANAGAGYVQRHSFTVHTRPSTAFGTNEQERGPYSWTVDDQSTGDTFHINRDGVGKAQGKTASIDWQLRGTQASGALPFNATVRVEGTDGVPWYAWIDIRFHRGLENISDTRDIASDPGDPRSGHTYVLSNATAPKTGTGKGAYFYDISYKKSALRGFFDNKEF